MLQCHRTRKNLTAFLTGELGTAEADRVRKHLEGCPGCRRERTTTEDFLGKVRSLEAVTASSGFEISFWKKVGEVQYRKPAPEALFVPGWTWRWGMGLSSAAVVILVLAVYFFGGSSPLPRSVSFKGDPGETAEIVKNFEFYRDLEVIEAMDRLILIEEDPAITENGPDPEEGAL